MFKKAVRGTPAKLGFIVVLYTGTRLLLVPPSLHRLGAANIPHQEAVGKRTHQAIPSAILCLSKASEMPTWNWSVESSDGMLNLFAFKVLRLAIQWYTRKAHFLITVTCIEKDS